MRVTQKNGLSYHGLSVRVVLPDLAYDEVLRIRTLLHCGDSLAIQAIVVNWANHEHYARLRAEREAAEGRFCPPVDGGE